MDARQTDDDKGGVEEVLMAEPRGFCAGVDRAIEIVERALVKFGAPIYDSLDCRGARATCTPRALHCH